MKRFICSVCGYVHDGDSAPERCPMCKVPAEKFNEVVEGKLEFVQEHVIGVAKGCDDEMIKDLNAHFVGECTEVGMPRLSSAMLGKRLSTLQSSPSCLVTLFGIQRQILISV